VRYIPEGERPSFAVRSKKNKLLYFESNLVVKKATRTAQGASILRTRNQNDALVELYSADELSFIRDLDYYRIAKIPTAGRYIREESIEERQLSLADTVL
jgi:hypothetical protein